MEDLEKAAILNPASVAVAMATAKVYKDKDYIGAGLKASRCVLNVLRELIEDEQGIVYNGLEN